MVCNSVVVHHDSKICCTGTRSLSRFRGSFPLFRPSAFVTESMFIDRLFSMSCEVSTSFGLLHSICCRRNGFLCFPFIFAGFSTVCKLSSSRYTLRVFERQKEVCNGSGAMK